MNDIKSLKLREPLSNNICIEYSTVCRLATSCEIFTCVYIHSQKRPSCNKSVDIL